MGIGDPRIEVSCDECGEPEFYSLTPLAGRCWDARNLERQMEHDGWRSIDGRMLCAGCHDEAQDIATRNA